MHSAVRRNPFCSEEKWILRRLHNSKEKRNLSNDSRLWSYRNSWRVNTNRFCQHTALMICAKNKLKQEIDFIKKILLDNGYPEDIVLKHTSKKIAQFSIATPFGPETCSVYLRAPWIGSASQQLEHQVKSACTKLLRSIVTALDFLKPMHATCCQKGCATCQSKKYGYLWIHVPLW